MTDQQPQLVQPAQVPMSIVVNSGDLDLADGTKRRVVQVQILSATGTFISFWDPDAAQNIAALIHKEAQSAKTGGLVVASADDIARAEAQARMPDVVDPKQRGNRRQRRGKR